MVEEVLPSNVAKIEGERELTMLGEIPLARTPSLKLGTGNAGLFFDKFCEVLDPKASGAKAYWLKRDFLPLNSRVGDANLIAEHLRRHEQLITCLGGLSLRVKTAGRFVTGLGYRHPLENGFAWHPVLGTPYLPGSGLKGLARAWAMLQQESDIAKIFGPRGEGIEPKAGSVIFLDMIPTQAVKLVAEVMTPHVGPYFQGDKPPADYYDPVPIPFLAVDKGVEFLVGLLPRAPGDKDSVERVMMWLREAAEDLGAGAKTAAGYGRFEVVGPLGEKRPTIEKKAVEAREPERMVTVLPEMFEVEFIDFVDARKARKKARERKDGGKEPKFREFALRPMNPAFAKLAGKLVCSSRDTEGYDLPFEVAERHAGVSQPFYVMRVENREGKNVARVIGLSVRDR